MSFTRRARTMGDAQVAGAAPVTAEHLSYQVINRVAVVTLNRPDALNALSHSMVRTLAQWVEQCRADDRILTLVLRGAGDKGFCAGGDVRALYQLASAGERAWQAFFIDEYRLDFALHHFPKPVVALMDGITMGGGMGLAQGASLRIATQRSRIAMPETRIGFVPDVGATRFLAVMPVELELYVGLTGVTLSGADAQRLGLADRLVDADALRDFDVRLCEADTTDIDRALKQVFGGPGPEPGQVCSTVDDWRALAVRHFNPRHSVEQIVASLRGHLSAGPCEAERAWLGATLDALTAYSPTMLNVTRQALLRGRHMTLAECLRMELAIATQAIDKGDFCEGVRAHLIDKDKRPRWAPATLAEVCEERVAAMLCSPWRADVHPLADLHD
ncbi:3-hydroxyisobutyryl-CoA hydrolase (EC 3.1.2.4) [Mycetohabitans rhizoxinica HKI 454]|uniref:3-hydroxyisobutyryl-CoA hydrolase n=2 Tax=Burkholderiaceae TaxID=119060 RepID=E5ASB4_MYCRK|nr:3-hydroxyisobutyryl-CoA hydrolase (EC 3.1.2.4) [Mycetohabitans rhizoxinica HKI 454]